MNSDVSLSAYDKLGTGATFTHPVTGLDDKSQFLNLLGILHKRGMISTKTAEPFALLFQAGTANTQLWADLLWISGGNLNPSKCFSYFILPKYNFNSNRTTVHQIPFEGHLSVTNPANHLPYPVEQPVEQVPPSSARRTLGVFMAPDGSNRTQLKQSLIKAKTFLVFNSLY